MNLPGIYRFFLNQWENCQTCWIISDTHFGDNDLRQGIQNRPSDEEIVKLINSKCGKADLLIHLGDVGNLEYVRQLRAKRKVLIMGNHDTGRTNYERTTYHEIFEADMDEKSVRDAMARLYPNCKYFIEEGRGFHTPFEWWDAYADNQLFDEVYEGPVMIGEKLILSHEPVNIPWAFNIHGHTHSGPIRQDKYHFNVCSDVIGYVPINLNQWMKQGHLAKIKSIHRTTIDTATIKSKKRKTHNIHGQKSLNN